MRLKLEALCVVNLARDFVTATYNLEGNVPLMFTGEEELLKVQNLGSDFGSLLKDTVRTELASRSMVNVTNTDYWTVEMDGGLRPMMAYFSSRFVTGWHEERAFCSSYTKRPSRSPSWRSLVSRPSA